MYEINSSVDSDDVRHPSTDEHAVFAVNRPIKTHMRNMLETKFPSVFADGMGKLEGEHHICLYLSLDSMQQAPRHVHIELRAKVGVSG